MAGLARHTPGRRPRSSGATRPGGRTPSGEERAWGLGVARRCGRASPGRVKAERLLLASGGSRKPDGGPRAISPTPPAKAALRGSYGRGNGSRFGRRRSGARHGRANPCGRDRLGRCGPLTACTPATLRLLGAGPRKIRTCPFRKVLAVGFLTVLVRDAAQIRPA
jgi:hypothetical protein